MKSQGECFHVALEHVGLSLIPWRKRNTEEREQYEQAAAKYNNDQLVELRASRADLARQLLEQCQTVDDLRATVAAYTQANHNQSVLIQDIRECMGDFEARNKVLRDAIYQVLKARESSDLSELAHAIANMGAAYLKTAPKGKVGDQ